MIFLPDSKVRRSEILNEKMTLNSGTGEKCWEYSGLHEKLSNARYNKIQLLTGGSNSEAVTSIVWRHNARVITEDLDALEKLKIMEEVVDRKQDGYILSLLMQT